MRCAAAVAPADIRAISEPGGREWDPQVPEPRGPHAPGPAAPSGLGGNCSPPPSFTVMICSIRTFPRYQIHVHSVKSKGPGLAFHATDPPSRRGRRNQRGVGNGQRPNKAPPTSRSPHRRHRNRPHGPSTPSPPRDFPHFSRLSPGCHRVGSVSLAPQYRPRLFADPPRERRSCRATPCLGRFGGPDVRGVGRAVGRRCCCVFFSYLLGR